MSNPRRSMPTRTSSPPRSARHERQDEEVKERNRLPDDATVETVVRECGAADAGRGVAVAVDGEVVPRSEWGSTSLTDGAHVEVLQAVQGG